MKYSVSFDHALYYVRRVRPVLDGFLHGNMEAQQEVLVQILKAYGQDQMSTQNFDNESANLFQVRRKIELLVNKLMDIDLLDPLFLVPVCIK